MHGKDWGVRILLVGECTLVLPSDLRSFIDYFVGTSLPYEDIVQSLSVSARSAESIWGTLCKKVHSCNKLEKKTQVVHKVEE